MDYFIQGIRQTSVFGVAELLRSLDWTAFEAAYSTKGRRPYHPRLMVGLVLLGIMEGVTSLRGLEARARRDVAWWWVTGGISPDHSILGRFLQLHSERLSGEFFEELTRSVVAAVSTPSGAVAMDGTVVQAAGSRYGLLKQEAAREEAEAARKAADDDPDDRGLRRRADQAEGARDELNKRVAARKERNSSSAKPVVLVRSEPEAVLQRMKNHSFAPAYKASVASTPERIIVGHAVDPTSEARTVEPMMLQAQRIHGQMPSQLLLDAGYFVSLIIALALEHDVDLLCPQGKTHGKGSWERTQGKQIPKSAFTYDEATNEYICPDGRRLPQRSRRTGHVYYKSTDCTGCPLKDACTKSVERSIKRYDDEEAKDALKEVMRQPRARAQYRKRAGWVEPVFAELRGVQGLARFRRRGLAGVRLEFALHTMAHNLRRFRALSARAAARRPARPIRLLQHIVTAHRRSYRWYQALIG